MKVKFTVELIANIVKAVKGLNIKPGDHQDVLINGIPLVVEINDTYPQSNPRLIVTYGKMFIINQEYVKFIDFPRLEVSVGNALDCLGSKQTGLSYQYIWKKINDTIEYQRYTDPANRTFEIKFPNSLSFVKAIDGIEILMTRDQGFHTLKPQSTKLFSLMSTNPAVIEQGMHLAVTALYSHPTPVVFEAREVDLDLTTSIIDNQLFVLKDGLIQNYFENDLREQMSAAISEIAKYPYQACGPQMLRNDPQPIGFNPMSNHPMFNGFDNNSLGNGGVGTNIYGGGLVNDPNLGNGRNRY